MDPNQFSPTNNDCNYDTSSPLPNYQLPLNMPYNYDSSSPHGFAQYLRPQQQKTNPFQNQYPPPGFVQYGSPVSNDGNPLVHHPIPSRKTTFPPFSTQDGLESIDPDVSLSTNSKQKKNEAWSNDEEELLMSAWVTISTDSITGNGQQAKDFWRRITQYYNDHRKKFNRRTQSQVKAHWYQVIPSVNEFNQIFINVEKQYHSGWSDDQVKDAARKLYYSTYKKNFKYEHAWVIVKDEPKWRGGSTNDVHTKRTKTDSSGSFTSSDVQSSFKEEDDETRVRPMGKKKATRVQKGKATSSNAEINEVKNIINETSTLRMSTINGVAEHLKELKESYKSSKKINELKMLMENTQGSEQLRYQQMLTEEIKKKYGI